MNNGYLQSLSQEELLILIKNCKDEARKHQLERLYKQTYHSRDIITSCMRIISQIGYCNSTIYLDELSAIIIKMGENGINYFYRRHYSEDALALVLVTEILDYYKAKYDEDYLLKLYEVDKAEYLDLKIDVNLFLSSYYWHKS